MLALLVTVDVKPDQRDRFLAAIEHDATGSVRDEPGCARFDLLEDQQIENRFYFYEVYRDEAAFQAHTQAPHYAAWAEARDVVVERTERRTCTVVLPRDYK